MNFFYKCYMASVLWNILYTVFYYGSNWIGFFGDIRHSIYDSVEYLTYIQFILPYENELECDITTSITETPLKKIEYEDKYKSELLKYSEYIRKDTHVIDVNNWKYLRNNILIENTPLGNVILYYDSVKDSFCYYSDRIIPYKYIDTVCRKYVIRFNCVPLYFDINNNMNTIINKELDEEKVGGGGCGKENNIFVKLKSYNKSNKGEGQSTAKVEICSYINRYTYEGKLMSFNMLQKPEKKKFSYLDFKNKQT